MLNSGDVLADRYRLDEPIAAGGMGEVWQANDTVLARKVAVKVVPAGDPATQMRFRREAQAMAALSHPGIVDVYDYGETGDGDHAYLVMALVAGEPLADRLGAAGRLDADETMAIVAQAARALHAAHSAGIVHRDVKPANLLVQGDGTVVLVDFGIAQSAGSTSLTGVHEVVGTAAYISPEQVSKRPTGPATDVYALGVVAYQCLAGHPPFPGDNPIAVAQRHIEDEPPPLPAEVPAAVQDLVTTAMAKDPGHRFPSAAAMAEAAETATLPAVRPPATAAERTVVVAAPPRRWPARTSVVGWVVGLLALVALGVVLAMARPTSLLPAPDNPTGSPGPVPASSGVGGSGPAPSGGAPASPGGGNPAVTVPGLPTVQPTLPEPTLPQATLPDVSLPAAPTT